VYRCAENKWVEVDIASPKVTYVQGGKTYTRTYADAGPDTVILYDPRHKVLFRYGAANTVHLMRYDDATVKTVP
jgi:hypothetical protein